MGLPVTVKNAVDTWVNAAAPAKKHGQGTRLQVMATASPKWAYIFFSRPWPPGTTITSAKIGLYSASTFAGATTVSAQRVALKWGANKLNYTDAVAKGVLAGTATSPSASGQPAGTLWEIDVTSQIQAVSDGGVWFGFRITTNNTSGIIFHSAQARFGRFRPYLTVAWSDAPEQPDQQSPSGARAVSIPKPVVRSSFIDLSGDTTMASIQVQVGTTQANVDAGTVTFDSAEVPSVVPQLDLATTAYAGMTNGAAAVWWRNRNKDGAGIWSPWGAAVAMSYFTKGTLTITTPAASPSNFLYDASPDVAWTFTGRTQRAYQVAVAKASDPNNWIWDSGKITSTSTSHTIPFGVLNPSDTFIVIIRVWDTIDREATPNDPTYVEASRSFTISYDGAVTAAGSFAMASDPVLPIGKLTWTRTATPDSWVLQRSTDGGTTWRFIDEWPGATLSTGGTNYAVDDPAPMYKALQWRILAVVGGKMAASSPTVSGQVRRLAPFLMRRDSTDAVCFLNPKRDRSFSDIQAVYETLGAGPPVVVTQKLGRLMGSVEGLFANDILTGVTADDMLARFLRMRDDSGQKMTVAIANDTFSAVAYNFQYDTITDATGIMYIASFDWVEWP